VKKINFLSILIMVTLFSAWGCGHSYNSMVNSGVGIDLKGDAKYEILGDTEAKAEVLSILGIFNIGAEKTGNFPGVSGLSGLLGSGKTLCEQAAAYKAIENFEGADQIISPRFKTEEMNYFVFGKYSSTVKAKAVKIIK